MVAIVTAQDFIAPACHGRVQMRANKEVLVKEFSQNRCMTEKSIPLTDGQRELWLLAQMSEQQKRIYQSWLGVTASSRLE